MIEEANIKLQKPKDVANKNVKRSQWIWFIGLWCAGLGSMLILAKIIKLVMNIV